MRLNPFADRRAARRELRSLRADKARLTAQLKDRNRQLRLAKDSVGKLTAELALLRDCWQEEHNRGGSAMDANQRLGVALAEERRKVAALEKIAGPYTDPRHTPTPAYDQVTSEHPLPTWPDSETTTELRLPEPQVKSLADAFGGGL